MTSLLNRSMAEFLFEGFSIQRWNDRLRATSLSEMDKNSCKMILTYFIGKIIEKKGNHINWPSLIDRGIYDIIIKTSLSDISSKVHSELRKNRENYTSSVIDIVTRNLNKMSMPKDYMDDFSEYVMKERKDDLSIEDKILRLSHHLAVLREYQILESIPYNTKRPDHELTKLNLENSCYKYKQELLLNEDEFKSIEYILYLTDCLRFQIRWSQTARLPSTSVLGHSLYAAILMYFSIYNSCFSPQRKVNNFYATLMHDFMESYTRDIISPVKTASMYFNKEIGRIENHFLEQELKPNLHESFRDDFTFLIQDEFQSRYYKDGNSINLPRITNDTENRETILKEFNEKANSNFSIDGALIKIIDYLAALIEAHQSIELGIRSHHLVGAISRLYSSFNAMKFQIPDDQVQECLQNTYDDFISR